VEKSLGSLKASATSLFQVFDASGILDVKLNISSVLDVTLRGNVFHRKVGMSICVEIVVVAVVMRSASTRIFEILGKIEAIMVTTSF